MSVDISQLTARLDPERQEAVKAQYEERATNPTATFLLCFFLGSAGAHRFYLREWRVAFAHLALFILGAASLVAGLVQTLPLTTQLVNHPTGFALDVIGVVLLLASLIWEIIDLGRIDHQVYHRNLLLAEGIIAATLLADQSVIAEARHKLDEVARQTHAHPAAATAAAAAATATAATDAPQYGSSGVITASEVADARALAEETGAFSTISYAEVSHFDVSEDPDQARQASADAAREGNWTESMTTSETLPAASADEPPTTMNETVTRTHLEDGPRVTDSYEVDRAAGPSTAEVVGLGAAGLGAAALGAGLVESAAHGDFHSAGFDEPTQPDHAISAAPEEAAPEAPFAAEPEVYEPATYEPAAYEPAAATGYADDGYGFDDDDLGDVTDASMPAVVIPAADIAIGNASPAYVQLPDEEPAAEGPAAPLYLVPDEPETDVYPYEPEPSAYEPSAYEPSAYEPSAYEPPASVEPPADAYVPPVASVYSQAPEAPAAPTPSWDEQTFAQPTPEPVAQEPVAAEPASAQPDTLAELAGFTGLAGAGALAGEALAHSHTPEPAPAEPVAAEPVAAEPVAAEPVAEPAAAEPVAAEPTPAESVAAEPATPVVAAVAPEPPKMKKIRVRRKVVVDGQVVAEEVVEREVPADMDTATAAAQIQAELSHLTPEQIAQRAHLAPGEEIELRQRTEGPSAE